MGDPKFRCAAAAEFLAAMVTYDVEEGFGEVRCCVSNYLCTGDMGGVDTVLRRRTSGDRYQSMEPAGRCRPLPLDRKAICLPVRIPAVNGRRRYIRLSGRRSGVGSIRRHTSGMCSRALPIVRSAELPNCCLGCRPSCCRQHAYGSVRFIRKWTLIPLAHVCPSKYG